MQNQRLLIAFYVTGDLATSVCVQCYYVETGHLAIYEQGLDDVVKSAPLDVRTGSRKDTFEGS